MFKPILQGQMALRNALIGLVGRLEKAAKPTLYLAAQQIRDEMREEGKPVRYPIQWDSERQRRAFFATNGFGRGIPTKRTGQAVNAWKAIRTDEGADVSNPLSHIVFISGRRQSRIHRGRWKLFHLAVDRVVGKLPQNLRSRLTTVIHEQGFKTQ